MATYTTYDQVGKAESVSDVITNITPSDTPFHAMIKDEKVAARTFSWLEDSLDAAGANAQVEGADAAMATLTDAVERSNTTQIMSKAFQVSATADAIKTYGRAKETAYQLGKALKALKKDVEFALVGSNQAAVSGSGSVARKMATVSQQITNTTASADGVLNETNILTAGQAAFNAGSDPSVLMIRPADAQTIAGYTSAAGRNREVGASKTLVNVVDLLVTPYGEYKVVLNRHQLTDRAFLIDPSMFKTATLRPFTRTLLAKNGDSDKHYCVGEMSVKHKNFADSQMITGLT